MITHNGTVAKWTKFFEHYAIRHVISLLALCSLLIMAAGSTDNGGGKSGTASTSSSSTVDLSVDVRFTGTQFIIHNKDSFDWTNVKLEVNSKTFSSGYILNVGRMAASETYTVGAMQFAKSSDGEKFNPFTHKPLNFSVSCDIGPTNIGPTISLTHKPLNFSVSRDTPRGKGFYYGSWE